MKKNNTTGLVVRFDSVGGASGDLILSSLCALGINPSELSKKLGSLHAGNFKLQVKTNTDHGFAGKQLTVKIGHSHHHHHRHLEDILSMIKKSKLSPWVKDLSTKVFYRLAVAEAKVHSTTPNKIHFHEVGALDSIVDIVGSCAALEMLGVDSVIAGPLPLGHGTVECAHGILPLPAPAVVELLKNHPVVQIDEPFETVTPTGAALLTTWKEILPSHSSGSQTILRTGLGYGHHKFNNRPNTLRATLLKSAGTDEAHHDECLVLECNLDDIIPEIIGSLTQKLMDHGALDVFTLPIQMKKQRPGTLLTVLCKVPDRDRMIEMIFTETTTFGIREHLVQRTILERRYTEVKTPYGKIRIKVGTWKGRDITFSPEHSDCVKCAEKHGVAVKTVYEKAIKAIGRK
ncbi:MAG: nickel pincer cofactor biosynthesis protein LarC [Kiritimatiellae bacterium]|nr:nickel pincer cofactor biosynthesis protein LarC [Kiritimatiellia bacterium]MDD5520656.1 nickel pincer cofactor biosynthesis protein LarC [Kiritimatiellia bacterium]